MDFSKYLIDKYTFERMQNYGDYDEFATFDAFMEWNLKCIVDLDDEDRTWVAGLCKRISKNAISMMDEESCYSHEVSYIYFDKNKNTHVVCPR